MSEGHSTSLGGGRRGEIPLYKQDLTKNLLEHNQETQSGKPTGYTTRQHDWKFAKNSWINQETN